MKVGALVMFVGIAVMIIGVAAIIGLDIVYWTEADGVNPLGAMMFLAGFIMLFIGVGNIEV